MNRCNQTNEKVDSYYDLFSQISLPVVVGAVNLNSFLLISCCLDIEKESMQA